MRCVAATLIGLMEIPASSESRASLDVH